MRFTPTRISEVILVEHDVHADNRGFFVETWHSQAFANAGIEARFLQDNFSKSMAGVLRGLHYQIERPQGKLVRVSRGAVFDVAVDIRRSSPTFGEWVGAELSGDNQRSMWIPPGFAHGFIVTDDCAEFI
ncbi:MAG: dTDP-4-dehydrorhamnose 3,5-epimerase, partial [Woeseiaceae bacterium]